MADTIYYTGNTSEKAVLVLFDKNGWIGSYPLGVCTVIGRQSANSRCDIPIASPIVSRNHGEIGFTGGQYFYRDSDSTNGTYYNNQLIGKNSPDGKQSVILSDGDILSFDIRNVNEHHAACVNALFCTGKNVLGQWKKVALDSRIAEICIGRSEQTGITIDSPVISEKHASFFCSKNGWAIIDHNSTNGVFLNGKRMKSPRYLNEMDVVRIADVYIIFLGDSLLFSEGIINIDYEPAPCAVPEGQNPPCENNSAGNPKRYVQEDDSDGLKIHIVERSAFQRFRKVMLLRDIDINIAKGQMVLILGGSGAGKTTFMNAVTGYEKAVGRITYQHPDIYEEYERMKYDIGFVPQQDLIRSSDTVYATVANAADMKLPRYLSMEERSSRIEEVLEELGLAGERQKLVSKLSGGQKKTLSIAV
ncbi:MAG: FHA domain-containing protein, partial [Ruminococcus sp.]